MRLNVITHAIASRWLLVCVLLSLLYVPPLATRASVNGLPNGFVLDAIGLGNANSGPGTLAFAPRNRIYVAEKAGAVSVWHNGIKQPQPFIDLTAEVNNYNERGLLGIAIDPQFPTKPYIYLYYAYDPPSLEQDGTGKRVARVERVAAKSNNLNQADPGSRTVLYGNNYLIAGSHALCRATTSDPYRPDCLPTERGSHVNGSMNFGPDGALYLSFGDNSNSQVTDANSLRAQDLDVVFGKILRIDPITGKGLSDNPFYDGDANSNRSRVFNYGIRNSYSFGFHPSTGTLYMADVGWNDWEEVNSGTGKNFGWPCYEGNASGNAQQSSYANDTNTQSQCQTLYSNANIVQRPVTAYDHAVGTAIIGGAFFTGTAYPAVYRNAFFVGDYGARWVKYITFDGNNMGTLHDFADNMGSMTQITRGSDGNIYLSVYNWATNSYDLKRIRYTLGVNQPPSAAIVASSATGPSPLVVQFKGDGSVDPEGQSLTYRWDFGDGASSTVMNPTYTYTQRGNRIVTLIVTDTQAQASDPTQINIMIDNQPPTLTLSAPITNTQYSVGDVISFTGSANDAQDGNLSARIQWTVQLHHSDHVHPNFVLFTGAANSFAVPDHGDDSWLEICAVVEDNDGSPSGTTCRALQPRTVQLRFDTQPTRLTLNYGGFAKITPFTVTSIVNSAQQLIAPELQTTLAFSSWSDGGTRSRTITVQPSGGEFVARYHTPTLTPPPSNRYFAHLPLLER